MNPPPKITIEFTPDFLHYEIVREGFGPQPDAILSTLEPIAVGSPHQPNEQRWHAITQAMISVFAHCHADVLKEHRRITVETHIRAGETPPPL